MNFANLVQQQNLVVYFKIQCRVDLLLQENNIQKIWQGPVAVIYGWARKRFSKILDAMDKAPRYSKYRITHCAAEKAWC